MTKDELKPASAGFRLLPKFLLALKCLQFILCYLVLSSPARQELKRERTATETKSLHSSHDAARPRKKSLRIGKDSAAAQPPAVARPPQPPDKVNALGGLPCEKAIAAPGGSETMPPSKGGSSIDSGDFKENLSKQLPSITTRHLQSGQQKFVCKVINSSGGVKRLMEGMQGRTLLSWRIAYKIISADDESASDDVLADDCDVADDCDFSENDEQVVGMSVAFSTETCWFVSAAAFRSHVEFYGICHKILTSGNALKVLKNASAHTHTLTYTLRCDRSSFLTGHSTQQLCLCSFPFAWQYLTELNLLPVSPPALAGHICISANACHAAASRH